LEAVPPLFFSSFRAHAPPRLAPHHIIIIIIITLLSAGVFGTQNKCKKSRTKRQIESSGKGFEAVGRRRCKI